MPEDLANINWEELLAQERKGKSPNFKKYCLDFYPFKNKKTVENDLDNFSLATELISKQYEKFVESISKLTLLSVVIFWIDNITEDKFYDTQNTIKMKDLIANGLIGVKDNSGHAWTIKHMVSLGHEPIIEAIRCSDSWSFNRKEDYVKLYINFVNWLSEKTLGYVPFAVDPDIYRIRLRRLPHEQFIDIAHNLSDRERIIAQLMYYGGTRTLEEIISLKIEDLDFSLNQLTISDIEITYPKYIIKQLKQFIDKRNSGYIFIGKHTGEKIDSTVPYRALKYVTSKLKLDPTFTFKNFVKDI